LVSTEPAAAQEIERDKKLVLDNENKSPGKWRGLHHDPERATRRGLLA
jgi:hypothetical protein